MMLAVISFLTPDADRNSLRLLRVSQSMEVPFICTQYVLIISLSAHDDFLTVAGTADFPRTSNCKLEWLQLSHLEFRPYAEMERERSLGFFIRGLMGEKWN
jgi:hypothetical protein